MYSHTNASGHVSGTARSASSVPGGPMFTPPSSDLPPSPRPASAVTAQPVAWLWPGRLGLGKLALLDGDPDLGKSLVSLDLCARLSTGRPWPDGSPTAGPQSAVVINAEDGE